jgi:hypothetical protein
MKMEKTPMGKAYTKAKMSPKQKKIASAAEPVNAITGADFKALRKKPKKKK